MLEFPLLLAGPIVRRVEPTRVCIWIATSKKLQVDADLFQIKDTSPSYQYHKLETVCEPMNVKIGYQLYIYLINITPKNTAFPVDTLIGYNIRFTHGSKQEDFESLELLSPEHPESIVYGNLKYPTFQIKSKQKPPHIFYGSCRKLHGEGEDTLAYADAILEKNPEEVHTRPDHLFLMGDQIYADDVPDSLIRFISKLSNLLIGYHEPLYVLDPRLAEEPFQTAFHQVNGRQFIMDTFCQFTSTQAQNHLIELGEYAAMYLLSWSPVLWEFAQDHHLFESFDELENQKLVHFAFSNQDDYSREHQMERKKISDRFIEQQEALISFQASLYRVRRLLANTPTYMIFDDHDLTDDWNISAEWKKNVENAPLGKHVIANGLAAYWAFQGWGNDPDSYDVEFIEQIKAYFKIIRKGQFLSSTYAQGVNLLWQFDSWHFVAPTYPTAVFLDTRTQRKYSSTPKPVKFGYKIEEAPECPQLLNELGWSRISKKLLTSDWVPNTPIILVSATPIYGMGLIESFLHDYIYPLQVIGVEVRTSFDFEAWKYNGEGFTKLLYQVDDWNPSECIFLSGDVHYASAVKATVTFPTGRKLPIHQFTSSPFKNRSFTGIWGALMKGVISLNSLKRKNKDIYRVCDPAYSIRHVKKDDETNPYLWKDQLRYQFLEEGSIIETTNNLGLLSISSNTFTNTLIKESSMKNK